MCCQFKVAHLVALLTATSLVASIVGCVVRNRSRYDHVVSVVRENGGHVTLARDALGQQSIERINLSRGMLLPYAGSQACTIWLSPSVYEVKVNGRALEQILSQAESLLELDLTGQTQITRFEFLQNLNKLESLTLCGTPFSGKDLHHLKRLENLSHLDLSKTSITDDDLAYLSSLAGIRTLKLDGTRVTAKGLRQLLKSKSLERVYVRFNQIEKGHLNEEMPNSKIEFISKSEMLGGVI
jgi:hypothetical protein